jgi:prolyl oligopeptidase
MHFVRRQTTRSLASLAALTLFALSSSLTAQSGPPPTERHDVTETFYGHTVTDSYRWLEDWHEGKAADWLKAQDTYTRSALETIPGREKFLARVKSLDTSSTRVRSAQLWGGKFFISKQIPAPTTSSST